MTKAKKQRNRVLRDEAMRRRVPSISDEGLSYLRRYQARSCLRKKKYGGYEEARLAAELVYVTNLHKEEVYPQPYKCLFCRYHHIGTHTAVTDERVEAARKLLHGRKAA